MQTTLPKLLGSFEPSKFYHVYNISDDIEDFFLFEEHYKFFLTKYQENVSPIVNTYAYCLLPKQYHFLIQIKSEKEIFDYLKGNGKLPEENITLDDFKKLNILSNGINFFGLHISKQFSIFFNSYSNIIHIKDKGKKRIFQKKFNRKIMEDKKQIKDLIMYIHLNPLIIKLVKSIKDWRYSSYVSVVSDLPTQIKRTDVLNLFDGIDNFIKCHENTNELEIAKFIFS